MEKVWPTRTFGRGETFYAGHSRSRSRKDRSFFFCLFVCFLTQDHLLSLYYECACCEGLGLPGYNRTLMDNSKMAGTEEESFTFKGDSGDM